MRTVTWSDHRESCYRRYHTDTKHIVYYNGVEIDLERFVIARITRPDLGWVCIQPHKGYVVSMAAYDRVMALVGMGIGRRNAFKIVRDGSEIVDRLEIW